MSVRRAPVGMGQAVVRVFFDALVIVIVVMVMLFFRPPQCTEQSVFEQRGTDKEYEQT